MKRSLLMVVVLTCIPLARAHAESSAPEVKGLMLGAEVTELFSQGGVQAGVRYWDDYLGAEFALGVEKGSVKVADVELMKATGVGVFFGGLAGVPVGRMKPHLRLDFAFNYMKSTLLSVKTFDIRPSVGLDFMAAEHLLVGIDVVAFPFVIWGEANGADVDGYNVSFMNSVRVAYVF